MSHTDTGERPGVLLFDVNETLLDIGPLKQKVCELLQDPSAGTLWFTSCCTTPW